MAYTNIYAPWRSEYFAVDSDCDCIFCDISSRSDKDEDNHVFYRDSICFGVMNKYPYTPGHFMLIPHRHVDTPTLLPVDEWLHLNKLSQLAIGMLEEYGANGINMGINIKQAAGAGIPKHLHIHFVPRFDSDTNFITTIGNARIYGIDFDSIFDKISSLAQRFLKID